MLELGLVADGFLGFNPCAEESVGLRPKTFFASCSGPVVENPTLDGLGKEGSVSSEPMHAMAHPSNLPHEIFKALSKPRAYVPFLLETEQLGAKEVEKVSYVANAKTSDYGEGVLESRFHLLSVLPCVGVDRASSSFPLSGGAGGYSCLLGSEVSR